MDSEKEALRAQRLNSASTSILEEAAPNTNDVDRTRVDLERGQIDDGEGDAYSTDADSLPPKSAAPQAAPPFSSGFWDKSADMTRRRGIYSKILGMGVFLTILVIFSVLSIYWGALFRLNEHVNGLKGWVVDFDHGPIGATFLEAFMNNTGLPEEMTWEIIDSSQFPNGIIDVENAVVQEKAWALVSINSGASTNLSAAIASTDASYNGSLAVTAYTNEARNENGYSSFIQPIITGILDSTSGAFATQNAQNLSSNSSVDLSTLLSRAPNVVAQPVYFTINNLRPFDVPVAIAVDFVGLIYLLIISFIVCMMHYNARVVISGLNMQLRLKDLLLLRIAIPFVLYFFVSVFFSLLSLAFQAPFDRFFGHSGFVIYWMMNWAGMCAMGLAMEALITILTPAFISFFLVLWIISNVSVCSVPIEVLPGVYKYGYAAPFYNVSRTIRAIVFGIKNEIGLNFGVQFAWIGISAFTLILFTTLMRKKEERAWRRKQTPTQNKTEKNA